MGFSYHCAFSYTTGVSRKQQNSFSCICTELSWPTVWHVGSQLQQAALAESHIKQHVPQLHFSIFLPLSFYLDLPDNLQHTTSQLYVTVIEMQSKASESIHQHSAKPRRAALSWFLFFVWEQFTDSTRLFYLIRSKWLGDEIWQTLATYASDQHLARTILCMCWMLNRQLPGKGK